MKSSKKKIIIGIISAVVLIAALLCVYFTFGEKPVEGSKTVTIEVVNKAEESTKYEVKTDAEYLRQAMDEAEGLEFSGYESEFGLTVITVNGESAVFEEDGAYWSFHVNGEYCNYGVDKQPIEDGDAFRIVYTLG